MRLMKLTIFLIALGLVSTNLIISFPTYSGGSSLSSRALTFSDASSGLPTDGGYNYVALGDFNSDGEIDLAVSGENYGGGINTVGVYAFIGDGGSSWTAASDGLTTENSWGGLQLVDADGDTYMELYATDEHWGANNNQGLKAWEYKDGTWTDAPGQVTTPVPTGNPDNVVITDITGDDKLDMIVCLENGLKYFENKGGNPAVWTPFSTGLPTNNEFTAAAAVDVNGDSLIDIVASDYSNNEYLFIQNSGPTPSWSDYSTGLEAPGSSLGLAVGDVNGDTHIDIIWGARDEGLKCFLGNSGGGSGGTDFTWTGASTNLPTNSRYSQIQLADIDADGDLDLIAPAGSGGKGMQIYLGNGNTNPGTAMEWELATGTNLPGSGDWYGSNVYDIDGDGALDLLGSSWGMGIGAWLNSGGGGTADITPPAAVTDMKVTETGDTNITISWTAPGDDGTTGTASAYDLRYSNSQITAATWHTAIKISNLPLPKPAGQTQNILVTGLEGGTTYHFAVITSDEVPNWSPISNSPSGTTTGITKPGLDVTVTPDKASIKPGEDVNLQITVLTEADKQPVAGASVTVSSDNLDVAINPTSTTTDSAGAASSAVTIPKVSTTTKIVIQVDVEKTGYKTSLNRITLTVNPPDSKFNLRITSATIMTTPTHAEPGDEVKITADVTNTGDLDATGFTIKIFVDDEQLGNREEYTQLEIDKHAVVERTWKASEGSHVIKVEITIFDENLDKDASDNEAQKTITVGEDAADDKGSELPWMWILIIIAVIVVVAGVAIAARGKKKGPGDRGIEDERQSKDNR